MNNAQKKEAARQITNNLKGREVLMSEEQKRDARAAFSVPATMVNGTHLAVTPSAIRFSFLEKSSDGEVHARSAVLMEIPNVLQLYKALHQMFTPEDAKPERPDLAIVADVANGEEVKASDEMTKESPDKESTAH